MIHNKSITLMAVCLSVLLLASLSAACPVDVFIPGQNGPWDMYGYGKWLDPFGNNVYNGGRMDIEPVSVDPTLGILMTPGDTIRLDYQNGYQNSCIQTDQHGIPKIDYLYSFANADGNLLETTPKVISDIMTIELIIPDGAAQLLLGCIVMDEWFNNNTGGVFVTVTSNSTTPCPATPVPEPATLFLMIGGIAGLTGVRTRNKK